MKRKLTHINPLKLGIMLGIIYGVIALIFLVPFFLVFSLIGAAAAKTGGQTLPVIFSGFFVLFMPVIYAVMGFIGGVITAFIYNLVAKWIGGIEFTTEGVQ